MRRFVEGTDRGQSTLFPECLEDWIDEDNPIRVIDVFVEELDLGELGFGGVDPEATGRPSYHPFRSMSSMTSPRCSVSLAAQASATDGVWIAVSSR
jgi:transposase